MSPGRRAALRAYLPAIGLLAAAAVAERGAERTRTLRGWAENVVETADPHFPDLIERSAVGAFALVSRPAWLGLAVGAALLIAVRLSKVPPPRHLQVP